MPLTAVAIRHVAFEDLGHLDAPLRTAGFAIRYVEAADGVAAVDPLAPDLLVVLGGPMGVYETAEHPFLAEELALLRARLAAGRPTLGLCLGAQLIAAALGARVYPGSVKEIGYAPVTLTAEGAASPLAALPAGQPVLHWHGDTFDLPAGATLLASTDLYRRQAFAVGRHALALQFHLEADRIERWLEGHAAELRAERIDPAALARDAARHDAVLRDASEAVLTRWLSASA
ncbi:MULTISPECIES: glutamine amidotransferase [unclassified Sphingomonas]|uniref:glutamine amidotransferase n=1 Tax=unclassified Sphingomonas TaxID=196159 RepID=UPI0017E0DA95|nr:MULTISPECIES: glutamine amidotransferase [unclassified Sphingomonas]MBB3348471.1 GMP synthase (glutamine-hydrolyzing) [Sphingomonas sp. BK069]MBB3474973.1 GMP synthase (glutamine-hydrolyzing) [Sphingomonas sp. BK345]